MEIQTTWQGVEASGRMLRLKEVLALTSLSRSQIYLMIAQDRFPPLIKLSRKISVLPKSWLDAFIEQKAAAELNRQDRKPL